MAHKIEIRKDKGASFFSVKEPAWHGLGKILEKCPTSEEAIKLANLDFEVSKAPVYGKINDKFHPVLDRFATYRTDDNTTFGVVSDRYEVVQNKDAFSFFDAIVGEGEAIYETAGALDDGRTIFITAKLPGYIRVGSKDDIEKYLLLTMSHDGTSSIQAMFTPIRVVCNNTLQYALNTGKNKVSIRHTKSAQDNLKEAHKIMGISSQLADELGSIFNNLTKIKVEDKQVIDYTRRLILNGAEYKLLTLAEIDGGTELLSEAKETISTRKFNIISDIVKYNQIGAGQDFETCKGTAFGAYNAVTGYLQNVKSFKDNNAKMASVILGSNYDLGARALKLATELWN